jgi:hypothetical protein
MSDYTRLNRGFVNWQGQRIFVPWFGAPRTVPPATDERRVLKLRFQLDIVPVLIVVLFVAIAVLSGGFKYLGEGTLAFGLCLFAFAMFLEQRWIKHWPQQSQRPLSRVRFMLTYYRSLPVGDRMWELAFGLGGVALAGRALQSDFLARTQSWDNWFDAILSAVGLGLFTFLCARYAATALVSLLPSFHRRTAEKSL